MATIRRCRDDERPAILAIVNAAAEAYRGVIPADRWREPYMPAAELEGEIAAGVAFWGYEAGGELVGIMGIQPVRDVHLIRHAYVLPDRQRGGETWDVQNAAAALRPRVELQHVAALGVQDQHPLPRDCERPGSAADADRRADELRVSERLARRGADSAA